MRSRAAKGINLEKKTQPSSQKSRSTLTTGKSKLIGEKKDLNILEQKQKNKRISETKKRDRITRIPNITPKSTGNFLENNEDKHEQFVAKKKASNVRTSKIIERLPSNRSSDKEKKPNIQTFEWTSEMSSLRSDLINLKMTGKITKDQLNQLDQLTAKMRLYSQKVAPLNFEFMEKMNLQLSQKLRIKKINQS